MSRFLRWCKPAAILVAFVLVAGGATLVSDGTTADAASSVTVNAGGGAAGVAVELFLPASVRLNVGDTLDVVNDYEEPHTLSFILNPSDIPAGLEGLTEPFGSSEGFNGSTSFSTGLLEKDQTASVTFASAGAFHFICLIHPGMELDVTVDGSGTPPVVAPGASAFLSAGIALGESAAAAVKIPPATLNPGGTSTWTVPTGPSVPFTTSTVDVMRFMAPQLEIGVGDTVVWSNDTGVPHTVTFLAGPPPDDFNPFATTKPSQEFDSTKLYNGIISAAPEFGGVQTFSLTFDKPGVYKYICVLHANQGMVGSVTVGGASAGGAISPPNTGDAGLLAQSSGSWMIGSGIVMLVASFLTTVGIAALRRR